MALGPEIVGVNTSTTGWMWFSFEVYEPTLPEPAKPLADSKSIFFSRIPHLPDTNVLSIGLNCCLPFCFIIRHLMTWELFPNQFYHKIMALGWVDDTPLRQPRLLGGGQGRGGGAVVVRVLEDMALGRLSITPLEQRQSLAAMVVQNLWGLPASSLLTYNWNTWLQSRQSPDCPLQTVFFPSPRAPASFTWNAPLPSCLLKSVRAWLTSRSLLFSPQLLPSSPFSGFLLPTFVLFFFFFRGGGLLA